MLYQWLHQFSDQYSALNVFRYITVRTFISFFTAFFVCYLVGPTYIRRLKLKQGKISNVREDTPERHQLKAGTPTMGGGLILLSLIVPFFLWMDISNPLVVSAMVTTLGFSMIGYLDDHSKVIKKNSKGVSGKVRLLAEFLVSGVVLYLLIQNDHLSTRLTMPFFKDISFDFGLFYVFFGSLVIVGTANAVNLTDGLDGLATGTSAIVGIALAVLAYVSSHVRFSDYLNVMYIPFAEELVVFISAFVGACIGFLWYNSYPAQVFMGDTGSLAIGGIIAVFAISIRKELLIPVLCGVFLIENLSVMLQVGYFKYSRRKYGEGRRIFKMAPLHHHYQKSGLHEAKIVARFWILAVLLAVVTIVTLKVR